MTNKMLASFLLLATVLGTSALAQDGVSRVVFSIGSQPLAATLNEFTRQTHVQVLWRDEEVPIKGVIAPSLSGEFSVVEALTRILAPAGLSFEFVNERTVRVGRIGSSSKGRKNLEKTAWVGGSVDRSFLIAQGSNNQAPQSSETRATGTDPAGTVPLSQIEEVVVTGSHIRGVPPIGVETVSISRHDIERSGYATVQDVFRTLPQNFGGGPGETTQTVNTNPGFNDVYGSSLNLRGLGADATLTLLDGRRMASSGRGTFVDVSGIPLNMVDRIEVVPDGASSTYGSDAVGGVANVILKRNFSGAETSVRYGALAGRDAPEIQAGQTLGMTWDSGQVLLGYEFYKRDSLPTSARRYTSDSDLTSLGGSNFGSTQSNPGNITRVGTTNVVLAIPVGQNGTTLSESQLLAGVTNSQNVREFTDLLPEQKRHGAVLSVSQYFGSAAKAYADILFSRRNFSVRDNRAGLTLNIPETNAYRVLNSLFPGQGSLRMAYNPTADLGPLETNGNTRAYTAVAGVNVHLGASWEADLYVSDAGVREKSFASDVIDTTALSAALAGATMATAFNPFADGSNTDATVLAGILGSSGVRIDTGIRAYNVKSDGDLFALPAGEVKLALGGELREEELTFRTSTTSAVGVTTIDSGGIAPGRRKARAGFIEAFVPLVGEANAVSGVRRLELTLSGREEHYDDAGNSFNPKVGLEYVPIRVLTFRGSYGRSFKAPLLKDTHSGVLGQVAAIPVSIDPFATGGSTTVLATAGGRRDLEPEKANTWSAGIRIEPVKLIHVDATLWHVDFKDRIATPGGGSLAEVFANPQLYPGIVIRDPSQEQVDQVLSTVTTLFGTRPAPGTVEAIADLSLTNLASVRIKGVDLNCGYDLETPVGQFHFTADSTYFSSYMLKSTETSPAASGIDKIGSPVKWKARTGLAWSHVGFGASAYVNYVDGYKDTLSIPVRAVDSWTTVDLQLSYRAPEASGRLSGTSLSLSAINLLNESPPFANNAQGFGFDPTNANPLGRMLAVDVVHRW